MPDPTSLLLFTSAALAILLVPGPAVLFVVARSLEHGHKGGLISILGITAGTLFHVAAAALGVSAILLHSAVLFQAVKLLGAAYLIWLGIQALLDSSKPELVPAKAGEERSAAVIFRQGLVVNLLNPKTALFFLAFLPQFVDLGRGHVAGQIVFLGLYFVVLAMLSDGLWLILASGLRHWIRRHPRYLVFQQRFAGGVYLALGTTTAVSGASK